MIYIERINIDGKYVVIDRCSCVIYKHRDLVKGICSAYLYLKRCQLNLYKKDKYIASTVDRNPYEERQMIY